MLFRTFLKLSYANAKYFKLQLQIFCHQATFSFKNLLLTKFISSSRWPNYGRVCPEISVCPEIVLRSQFVLRLFLRSQFVLRLSWDLNFSWYLFILTKKHTSIYEKGMFVHFSTLSETRPSWQLYTHWTIYIFIYFIGFATFWILQTWTR